jgi:class 3 adenylate cyclase
MSRPSPAVVALFVLVFVVAMLLGGGPVEREIERVAERMESIAAEVAAGIDPRIHARIHTAADAGGADFATLSSYLRTVEERYELRSPIHTLRPAGDGTQFVVMTEAEPFVGAPYEMRAVMRPVFEDGLRARSGLYGDARGRWISGYAPVRNAGGKVVALVEVNEPGGELFVMRWRARATALGAALGVALALSLLLWLSRQPSGPVPALRRGLLGSLTVRLAMTSGVPVLIGISIVLLVQVRERRADAFESVRDRLLSVVTVAAPRLDPALHAAVVASGDPASPEFLALRDELRRIRKQGRLDTAVYTLRRDGERTRFVVMTNEEPFVGHTNELRAEVRSVLNGRGARVEGPYTDAHNTWISAFAPIPAVSGHGVAAVLQIDREVTPLLAALRIRTMRDVAAGTFGILSAFFIAWLLARRVARPIREVAAAAAKIQSGDFDVQVSEDRTDEVGLLGRAVNAMALELAEKEKLRNMFGKYMAREVVRDLLDKDELSLTGEEREVTVLLSDIRGFTALSEELGPEGIVALLNDYFAILIDAVIECEGVIDKFMGDALLAWFGAPVPQHDHAARCVRCATMIQERTALWNAKRVAAGKDAVATGIGLASGPVVVGNIGSEKRFEYTAIGDAVNLASRLCSKAGPGEVVTTAAVASLGDDDRFEPLGAIEVRGVRDPVECFRMVLPVVAEASSTDRRRTPDATTSEPT